jgi:osmotically-inducible protein OsmY
MKIAQLAVTAFALCAIGPMVACHDAAKSPDVSDTIHKSLDQQALKDVTVSEDRDKGVVTLAGHVDSDAQKAQAEQIANSLAAGLVVADQIAVVPAGAGNEVSAINSDLDKAIEKNLDAALIQNKLHKDVNYAVKNGVVTLSGDVRSEIDRTTAQSIATAIPNVHQVVNTLQVPRNRKATSSR